MQPHNLSQKNHLQTTQSNNTHINFSFTVTPEHLAYLDAEQATLASISSPFLHPYSTTITKQLIIIHEKDIDFHVTLDIFLAKLSFRLSAKVYLKIAKEIVESVYAYHQHKLIHNDICLSKFYIKNTRISLRFPYPKALDRIDKSRRELLIKESIYMSPEVREGQIYEQAAEVWAVGMVILQVVLSRNLQEEAGLVDCPQNIQKLINEVKETPIRRILSLMLKSCADQRKHLYDILAQLNCSNSNPEETLIRDIPDFEATTTKRNAQGEDKVEVLPCTESKVDIISEPIAENRNEAEILDTSNKNISQLQTQGDLIQPEFQKRKVLLKLDLFPTSQPQFRNQNSPSSAFEQQRFVIKQEKFHLLINFLNDSSILLVVYFSNNPQYSISYHLTQKNLQQNMPNILPNLEALFLAIKKDNPEISLSPSGHLNLYFEENKIEKFQLLPYRQLLNEFREKFVVDIQYKSGRKTISNKGFYISEELILTTASNVFSTAAKRRRQLLKYRSGQLFFHEEYSECSNQNEDKVNYSIIYAQQKQAFNNNIAIIINFDEIEGRGQQGLFSYWFGTQPIKNESLHFSCKDSFMFFYVDGITQEQAPGEPLLVLYQYKVLVVGMYIGQGKGIIFGPHHQSSIHSWLLSKHQHFDQAIVEKSLIFTPLDYYLKTSSTLSNGKLQQSSRKPHIQKGISQRIQELQEQGDFSKLPMLYLRQAEFLSLFERIRNYQNAEEVMVATEGPQAHLLLLIRYLKVRSLLKIDAQKQLLAYLQKGIPEQESVKRNNILLLFLYNQYSKLQSVLNNRHREIDYIKKQIVLLKQLQIYKLVAQKLEEVSVTYQSCGDKEEQIQSLKEAVKYHELAGNRHNVAQVILMLVKRKPTIDTIQLLQIFTLFFKLQFPNEQESRQVRQELQLHWKKLYIGIINQSQNVEQVLALLEIARKNTGLSEEIINITRRKFSKMAVICFT